MKNIVKNNVFRIISFLWLGQIISGIAAFGTQVLLSKTLTIEEYGALSVAMSAVMLFNSLAGFGIGAYWLRCFGKEGWAGFRWVPGSLRLAIVSTTFTLLLIITWAWLGGPDPAVKPLMYWLSGLLVSQAALELTFAVFQLQGHYYKLAFWQVTPHLSRFLVALVAYCLGLSATVVAQGYLVFAVLIFVYCLINLFRIKRGSILLHGHGEKPATMHIEVYPGMLDVAKKAWPFALAGVFYLVYFQSNLILISWIKNAEQAAIYNIAFVILSAVYLLPSVIYQKYLLPHFHRWAEHDKGRFLSAYRYGNGLMVMFGVVFGILLAILSPIGVPLVFGHQYSAAGRLMLLLCLCVPVRFLATSVGATLVTGEHMKRKVRYQGAVAVLNVALNLVFIPAYGIYGAAVVTVISEVVLLGTYLFAVKKFVFGVDAWRDWCIKKDGGI